MTSTLLTDFDPDELKRCFTGSAEAIRIALVRRFPDVHFRVRTKTHIERGCSTIEIEWNVEPGAVPVRLEARP